MHHAPAQKSEFALSLLDVASESLTLPAFTRTCMIITIDMKLEICETVRAQMLHEAAKSARFRRTAQDSETVKPSAKIIQNQGLGLLQYVYFVQAGQGTASEDHSSHRSAFRVHHPKLSSPLCQTFKVSS